MSQVPTIHCQYYGRQAMCGAVPLYPVRAVVPRTLFAQRMHRRAFKTCRICERKYLEEQRREVG